MEQIDAQPQQFLFQLPPQNKLHPRQESADSGVGGMGSNFNLDAANGNGAANPNSNGGGDDAMDTGDLDTTLTPSGAASDDQVIKLS